MTKALCRLLFAIAAAATLAANTGVALPPHRVPPGTPINHTMALGAYRFVFLIDPLRLDGVLAPEMGTLHKAFALAGLPMSEMSGMDPTARDELPLMPAGGLHPGHDLALTLALLVLAVPRLSRPTPRFQSELVPPTVRPAQWRPAPPLAPPRVVASPPAVC